LSSRSPQPILICDYDPGWPAEFRTIGSGIRQALGPFARRIDHIGSTSVSGLAAKPIIDIQISVESLEPMTPYLDAMGSIGFVWRQDNPELTKRYFRESTDSTTGPNRRTHVHVRVLGSWHEQYALLFRDYIRQSEPDQAAYEAVKRELALTYRNQRQAYTEAKSQIFWQIIERADRWAGNTGWSPGPPDL
jgi:GrpB-like predicted nucleotidyltransferase (UPF0157 family)